MVGATPWNIIIGCFITKSVDFNKYCILVFLYQYIILLASLIYFWRGGLKTPMTPLGSAPDAES